MDAPDSMELSQDILSNLRSAFVAEAMTVQRYAYFAQAAAIEGLVDVSNLFTELAESAACAAHGHLDLLQYTDPVTDQPIGETRLNIAAAVSGELKEAAEFSRAGRRRARPGPRRRGELAGDDVRPEEGARREARTRRSAS